MYLYDRKTVLAIRKRHIREYRKSFLWVWSLWV